MGCGRLPGQVSQGLMLCSGWVKQGLEGTATDGDSSHLVLCTPVCSAVFCFCFLLRWFWMTPKISTAGKSALAPNLGPVSVLGAQLPGSSGRGFAAGENGSEPLVQGVLITNSLCLEFLLWQIPPEQSFFSSGNKACCSRWCGT